MSIDASTTAVNGVIQLYAYEPFNNVFTSLEGNPLTGLNSSTELLSSISGNETTTVSFSDASGFNFPITTTPSPVLRIQDTYDPLNFLNYSVIVGPGRFFPPASGTPFSFPRNEPIAQREFTASIPIQPPVAIPALPVGLSFVRSTSNTFYLTGTPVVQGPTTSNKIIAKGIGGDSNKVVTVDVAFSVTAEKLYIDVSGQTTVPLTIGSNITPVVFTARAPPYPLAGGRIKYAWSSLLDGLKFTDINGIQKSSPFTPADASSTLILAGAPTATAANSIDSSFRVNITATRTFTSPAISSNTFVDLCFNELVLVTPSNIASKFYVGLPVTSSASSNSFYPFTKFPTGVPISTVWSPDLRSDISIAFNYSQQRAYLTGTPSNTDLGIPRTFQVYARNANNVVGSSDPIQYSVEQDALTFQATDTCLNFIVGRSATQTKTGYYTAPVRFTATATSGCNVTYSTSDLTGTGLTLSSGQIIGTPTSAVGLSTLTVRATCAATAATKDTSLNFAILSDAFTFPTKTFDFFQNTIISPYQFDVSTLSGRPIVAYFSSNLPSGLSLSLGGLLSGTPTTINPSGTFTVTTFTGYSYGSNSYSYDTRSDAILLVAKPSSYTYPTGTPVYIHIKGITTSGKVVTNYALADISASYGLSIGSSTGIITGVLTDNQPPNPILPPVYPFSITGKAGLLDGSVNATITTSNSVVSRKFVMYNDLQLLYNDGSGNVWNTALTQSGKSSISFVRKNNILDSNVFLFSTGESITKSTNGRDFYSVTLPSNSLVSTIATDSSNWWMIGRQGTNAYLFSSSNDGDTWTLGNTIRIQDTTPFVTRDSNQTSSSAYLRGGGALAHKDGILVLGGFGNTMCTSPDYGDQWFAVTNGMQSETAYLSLDHPTVWLATGSDAYTTLNSTTHTIDTQTIKYSVDNGYTWSNTTGAFNHFGYEVVYASNAWLATGVNYNGGFKPELRYSTNGVNWTKTDLSTNELFSTSATPQTPPLKLGPIGYDGSNWNVFVSRNSTLELYRSSNVNGPWSVQTIGSGTASFVNFLPPTVIRSGEMTSSVISINSVVPNAVAFTAPTQTSYIFYQYMPIKPIVFSATGVGEIYYLTDLETLPVGLVFDPVNGQITGTPMHLGEASIEVYARDSTGVTKLVLYTNTILPRIVKNQVGAGAYTSLIRQYTEVNAADNARNNRVLPTQTKNLGEFQSPYKSDVVSVEPCPKC